MFRILHDFYDSFSWHQIQFEYKMIHSLPLGEKILKIGLEMGFGRLFKHFRMSQKFTFGDVTYYIKCANVFDPTL